MDYKPYRLALLPSEKEGRYKALIVVHPRRSLWEKIYIIQHHPSQADKKLLRSIGFENPDEMRVLRIFTPRGKQMLFYVSGYSRSEFRGVVQWGAYQRPVWLDCVIDSSNLPPTELVIPREDWLRLKGESKNVLYKETQKRTLHLRIPDEWFDNLLESLEKW